MFLNGDGHATEQCVISRFGPVCVCTAETLNGVLHRWQEHLFMCSLFSFFSFPFFLVFFFFLFYKVDEQGGVLEESLDFL